MGWHLSAKIGGDYIDIESDVDARRAFAAAAEEATRLAGASNWELTSGGADGSACQRMWYRIAGENSDGIYVQKEDVPRYFDLFKEFIPDELELEMKDLISYWSIRLLLKVCVEKGYYLEVNI